MNPIDGGLLLERKTIEALVVGPKQVTRQVRGKIERAFATIGLPCDLTIAKPKNLADVTRDKLLDIAFVVVPGSVDEAGQAYKSCRDAVRACQPIIEIIPVFMSDEASVIEAVLKVRRRAAIFEKELDGSLSDHRDVVERVLKVMDRRSEDRQMFIRNCVHGTAVKSGDETLVDQVSFLRSLKGGLAESLFPPVLDVWRDDRGYCYQMPFYHMETMRGITVNSIDYASDSPFIERTVTAIVNDLFDKLYCLRRKAEVPAGFLEKTFFGRFQNRCRGEVFMKGTTAPCGWRRLFTALLSGCNLIRTGEDPRELVSPVRIIQWLSTNSPFQKKMTPTVTHAIHGDIHLANILVDIGSRSLPKYKLIDPRGYHFPGRPPGIGDVAYDLGKIRLSTHGGYDLIDGGFRTAQFDVSTVNDAIHYQWNTPRWVDHRIDSGATPAEFVIHRRTFNPWVDRLFDQIRTITTSEFAKRLKPSDGDWRYRAEWHEAMHCFCVSLLQGAKAAKSDSSMDGKIAASVAIRGAELLDECMRKHFPADHDALKN